MHFDRPTDRPVRAEVGPGRDRAEHVFNCTGRVSERVGPTVSETTERLRDWQAETIGQTDSTHSLK